MQEIWKRHGFCSPSPSLCLCSSLGTYAPPGPWLTNMTAKKVAPSCEIDVPLSSLALWCWQVLITFSLFPSYLLAETSEKKICQMIDCL